MDEEFLLADAPGAQEFLRAFSSAVRRKGDRLARAGAVSQLTPEAPGKAYSAVVTDDAPYEVQVYQYNSDGDAGWDGSCSCDQEFDCGHICAVMRELLAQHSAAVVRNLSAGMLSLSPGGQILSFSREQPKTANDLAARLKSALGRPLNAPEAKFVAQVRKSYQLCRQAGQMTYWALQELGPPLNGIQWHASKLWPSFPPDDYWYWLYLVNAAQEQGTPIPKFMEPVSDLGPIQERIAQWRRTRDIERWNATLSLFQDRLEAPRREPGERDLRLVVTPEVLRAEWKRPGQAVFEPLRQIHFSLLTREYGEGRVQFSAEAEWIWQSLDALLGYGMERNWSNLDGAALRSLNRLLRSHLLENRMVNAAGQPLARPPDSLRWELVPAPNPEGDYQLRLVQADGTPLPELLAVLPGTSTLYLTPSAVFSGPASPESVLDPAKENRIPAPALESALGVALLRKLGVELPESLRQRVRVLPYQITIGCELRPTYSGSKTEDCVVQVQADSPDGRSLTWNSYGWVETVTTRGRKSAQNKGDIVVYDSSALAEVRSSIEPLELKQDAYGKGLVARVTRKFPELFARWLQSLPPQFSVTLAGELASLAKADIAGSVRLDVTEAEIDWFDLRVVLDVTDTALTPEEIQLLLKAKGHYVRLAGKGWRRLQFDLTPEENEHLARLGLNARELTAEPQRFHALQLADEAAKRFLPEQQVERIQRRASELKTRVTPPLPAGVTAKLRPYQTEGYHFLAYLSANRFGGILADDMGLGKTLQTLAWLVWLREQAWNNLLSQQQHPETEAPGAGQPHALVICPKSVMDNWRAEAARFTPALRVRVWSAGELEQFNAGLGTADLHVINYSQLRTLGQCLASVPWQAVILDEGQYIKNPNSQTAQVARTLRAEHRLVLSGTPIENRLLDLWSLLAFAMPGVLGNRTQFARLYDGKGDPLARRRLAARVRPFLLRRTKAQVAKDLPDRIEEELFCEMEGEQKTLYQAELKRAQQLLLGIQTQKELAQQQFHFLVSLLRLRQICCDPRLRHPDSAAPSAKTEALLEQLEPLMDEGQKVLVFSQFVEMLDILRPVLIQRNWPVYFLAGDTENRGQLVQDFQSCDGPAVFLISLKAGGFGLNLTAASYVVLFDPWWNPAVENQAIDRTHRIGQTNKVIAYRLLIKNSIEEKIRALQKKKKGLAEDVLGEERFAQSLSLDDLRFLFAD